MTANYPSDPRQIEPTLSLYQATTDEKELGSRHLECQERCGWSGTDGSGSDWEPWECTDQQPRTNVDSAPCQCLTSST